MKVCKGCGELKPLDQFYNRKRCRGGKAPQCKACDYIKVKEWQVAHTDQERDRKAKLNRNQRAKSPHRFLAKRLWHAARQRSIRFNLPFDLTESWILERIEAGHCQVTGAPFTFGTKEPFVPSLDQREPGAGYTTGNTQVVVWIYNAAKQHWGHDAVLKLAEALSRRD